MKGITRMTIPLASTGIGFAAQRIADLERDNEKLRQLVESLAVRVAVQAEMLGRAAEHRGEAGGLAGRVKELEGAIAPFAAALATGWDRGELPADALYPVMMGDLRRAARVLAETQVKSD
jgi:hypothetical protein